MKNVEFKLPLLSRVTVGHAARMLIPGPIISGFKIPGLARLGPLEELEETMGAADFLVTVPLIRLRPLV